MARVSRRPLPSSRVRARKPLFQESRCHTSHRRTAPCDRTIFGRACLRCAMAVRFSMARDLLSRASELLVRSKPLVQEGRCHTSHSRTPPQRHRTSRDGERSASSRVDDPSTPDPPLAISSEQRAMRFQYGSCGTCSTKNEHFPQVRLQITSHSRTAPRPRRNSTARCSDGLVCRRTVYKRASSDQSFIVRSIVARDPFVS